MTNDNVSRLTERLMVEPGFVRAYSDAVQQEVSHLIGITNALYDALEALLKQSEASENGNAHDAGKYADAKRAAHAALAKARGDS
jgi:hypothetical protein